MLSSLLAFVAIVAVNGAVVQRDGMAPSSSVTTSSTPCTTTSSTTPCTTSTTTSVTPCKTGCVPPTSTTPCTTSTTSTSSMTPCTRCTPPVTTTSDDPVTTSTGTVNCNGVQQWQASFAYAAGNKVIFNNQLFTATQWTFNNEPPAHPDQWTAGGTCAQPINNKVNCAGVAAWQSNVAYTAGNQVTSNNHLWSAVQWTQSNPPGDTSGSWKDLGGCA